MFRPFLLTRAHQGGGGVNVGDSRESEVLVRVFVGQGVNVSGTEVAAAGVEVAGKGAGVRVDSAGIKSEVGLMVGVGVGVVEVEEKNKIPAMTARARANTATARTNNPIKVNNCLRGGR